MVATDRMYGVIHLYEMWWFCCRTDSWDLLISDPLKYTDTSSSFFQALFALTLQNVHIMPHANHHIMPPTPSTARRTEYEDVDEEDPKPPSKTGPKSWNLLQKFVRCGGDKRGQQGKHRTDDGQEELAADILMIDCDIEGHNDNVQLLSNKMIHGYSSSCSATLIVYMLLKKRSTKLSFIGNSRRCVLDRVLCHHSMGSANILVSRCYALGVRRWILMT
jgi:hypothetical protein